MKLKVIIFVLLALSAFTVFAYADGLDGTWDSEAKRAYDNKSYKTYEINLKGDNVCVITQASINIDDALIITTLHDCVADMTTNKLSYRVHLAEMRHKDNLPKDYAYRKPSKDNKMYTADFTLNGNKMVIGKETFYKR